MYFTNNIGVSGNPDKKDSINAVCIVLPMNV